MNKKDQTPSKERELGSSYDIRPKPPEIYINIPGTQIVIIKKLDESGVESTKIVKK